VLQRVVLRHGEDVEAEDGLEQRRVREGDRLGRVGAEAKGDDRILFLAKKLIPPSPSGTVASMRRSAILILAAMLGALSGSARGATAPTLNAIVGTNDGYNITLNDATGKKVERLLPGTYTVVVDDRSKIHNFHLASNDDPTVDFRTDLDFVGQKSFTVTFRNNAVYAYACEPHWQVMNGSFLVTDAPAPPPPPPPPTPPPVRTLKASVTPAGAVRLGARSVRSGRYRIVVSDRSRSANFHLRGRGANARTGMAFRGTKTLRVRLSRGTYRYGSDRVGLSKRLRVR
jgi:hypothetical protein